MLARGHANVPDSGPMDGYLHRVAVVVEEYYVCQASP
jgi:hypothetical protein